MEVGISLLLTKYEQNRVFDSTLILQLGNVNVHLQNVNPKKINDHLDLWKNFQTMHLIGNKFTCSLIKLPWTQKLEVSIQIV